VRRVGVLKVVVRLFNDFEQRRQQMTILITTNNQNSVRPTSILKHGHYVI